MNPKSLIIKFFAPITPPTSSALIQVIDKAMKDGIEELTLLISSSGGNTNEGISLYNYLKGIPIKKIITHNFGITDSIAVVIFCAGEERFSSPQGRFVIHGVSIIGPLENIERQQIKEIFEGVDLDIKNISEIIAKNTNKSEKEIIDAMNEKTTLNPSDARDWGLINGTRTNLFEKDSHMISILSPDGQKVIITDSARQSISNMPPLPLVKTPPQ